MVADAPSSGDRNRVRFRSGSNRSCRKNTRNRRQINLEELCESGRRDGGVDVLREESGSRQRWGALKRPRTATALLPPKQDYCGVLAPRQLWVHFLTKRALASMDCRASLVPPISAVAHMVGHAAFASSS
jgi:hypothetical protein